MAGTTAKYAARKAELVTAVATSLNIPESDVNTQLYDANYDDNFVNEDEDPNLNTASGKVFLTYNPDIFKDQSMAAYQVWAGALVDGVKQANSAINTAIMQVSCSQHMHPCRRQRYVHPGVVKHVTLVNSVSYSLITF